LPPTGIERSVQLLVEGRTPKAFFEALLAHLGLGGRVQVQDFGGVDQLRGFVKALGAAPGFSETVEALGCVRDAEASAPSAFQSVCDALRAAGLRPGPMSGSIGAARPRVGVYILPDGTQPGMLESLFLESVAADPAMGCVEEFIVCLGRRGVVPRNPTKARAQAFMASRGEAEALVGRAARQGHWPLAAGVLEPLRRFLAELAAPPAQAP